MVNTNLNKLSKDFYDFTVNKMGWNRDWLHGGCYLHLESSEFIEALRGKGDPIEELGDVLLVLLSVAYHYKLDIGAAIEKIYEKIDIINSEGIDKYVESKRSE